ncbi:MAG: 6,7-dimethyl-8-ribityllumazine synthase [SAR324 cluster bacterium]|uniref:6,7-dimethyl-8-ribityllumazine synthase n=1 Tax=SAR324 cluster bacterium TaxID=2024889 RepID=A0A7X9FSK1_9DELT|nr:6,7-dimethyl-8-ribityllumazine synthase [SAR324 cluster bacterium]
MKQIEGMLNAQGYKIGLVAARFNDFMVEHLIGGAQDCFVRHGGKAEDITLVRVPGSFEIPFACQELALTGKFDGIVALGAVIRGSTDHYELVAAECAKGIAQASLSTKVPISFGVITTDTIDQAIERSGSKAGNKGAEATSALIEMIGVTKHIRRTKKA